MDEDIEEKKEEVKDENKEEKETTEKDVEMKEQKDEKVKVDSSMSLGDLMRQEALEKSLMKRNQRRRSSFTPFKGGKKNVLITTTEG